MSSDTSKVMVDTNVVVYAYNADEPRKHDRANQLLRELSDAGRLVYSVQVLNEFYAVMMRAARRQAQPWSRDDAAEMVRELAATGEVLHLTRQVTLRALPAIPKHQLSFWDSLIWAAAKEHDISLIYSEDFQHNRDIEGVRCLNPFLSESGG